MDKLLTSKQLKKHWRFEGQERFVPHFYELWGESAQSEEVFPWEGRAAARFEVTESDVAKFPELDGIPAVCLMETNEGFVEQISVQDFEMLDDAAQAFGEELDE
jgi:hypothetical protein